MERAVDWIFSHMDELNEMVQPMETEAAATAAPPQSKYRDGQGSQLHFGLFCSLFFLLSSSNDS